MDILLIILSVLWFIVKVLYRLMAIMIDLMAVLYLIIFWPFTILFGGLRSKVSDAIGAMFRRVGHHFKAIFNSEGEKYHPLKSDGTWDMRYKMNK